MLPRWSDGLVGRRVAVVPDDQSSFAALLSTYALETTRDVHDRATSRRSLRQGVRRRLGMD